MNQQAEATRAPVQLDGSSLSQAHPGQPPVGNVPTDPRIEALLGIVGTLAEQVASLVAKQDDELLPPEDFHSLSEGLDDGDALGLDAMGDDD